MAAFIKVNNTWIWIIGTALFVLIVFFSVQFFMVQSINPILEQLTKTAIKDASKGVYKVEFDDFKFNLASTTLKINGFKLVPDTARYNHLLKQDSIGPDLFTIHVPELRMRRINLFHIITGKSLKIHDIILNDPIVEVLNHPDAVSDSIEAFDLNDLFSETFRSVNVGEIRLRNLKLNYTVQKEDAPPPIVVNRINLRLFNLYIDSASFNDPGKTLYTDYFELKVFDYSYKLPDSLYTVKIKEFGLSQSEATIYIDSLELVPKYDPYRFTKVVGIETDRIDLKINRVELSHIDMGELLNYQKLKAGLLTVTNTNIDVFRDKRYPIDVNRRPKMLHLVLKDMGFYIKLDTIKVVKANVVYKEHGEESSELGQISFNSIYATIYGISNDSILIKSDKVIADVQAQLYGSYNLRAQFKFDIGHPKGKHEITGSLSPMDLKSFNKLILPMANVNIEEGKLHSASFYVTANDDLGSGKMNFKYDDLKIKILDKDGENGLKEKITSFVANTFVVKKGNPGEGEMREGNINYTRDKSRSMFHFWGRIMLTGVASSVGISDKSKNKKEVEAGIKKDNKRSRKS